MKASPQDAAFERWRLLRLIKAEGEQPVLKSYADRFLFPDITLGEWCSEHNVRVRMHNLRDDNIVDKSYEFIVFSKIDDDEW